MSELQNKASLIPSSDPLLKEVMPTFDFQKLEINPLEFADLLVRTMISYNGIGLAANQIGFKIRAFAMASNPVLVCFNPRIVDSSSELVELEEGCLTFPGLFLKIKRPKHIKVRFQYPNGEMQTEKYTGMTARIFQHELDHLNGRLYTSMVGPMALTLAKNKAKKISHAVYHPTETTQSALQEVRDGGGKKFQTFDEMMKDIKG